MIFRYEVCYQREYGMAYESACYSNYDRALTAYDQRIRLGYREVAIYDQVAEKFIIKYDQLRSERSLLKWGLLKTY